MAATRSLGRSQSRHQGTEREQSGAVPAQHRHLSPINTNYTRIYSAALARAEQEIQPAPTPTVSSDSDYDTIYSNKEEPEPFIPIGKTL